MEVKKNKAEFELHISEIDAEDKLFNSKTKAYHARFVNWAKETIDRGYLFDLLEASLSSVATEMLINKNTDPEFYRGQASALLKLKEIIVRKANAKTSAVSDKED
jgi:predicted Mrr-cat superfamily restriction endonuclease